VYTRLGDPNELAEENLVLRRQLAILLDTTTAGDLT
jgi:hypothetical protein